MHYDALIIGGGPAGLAAALMLGRARRRVLLCDAGPPRNAPAHHSHGFLTRDGAPPSELIAKGRADLAAYPGVELRTAEVTGAEAAPDGFVARLADGSSVRARGIVVAAGVRDHLPDTPGFAEMWGTGVFFCPYCHGWELRGETLAVYGQDAYATHMVYLLKAWTDDVVLVPDGPLALDADARTKLARNDIRVREGRVAALEGDDDGLRALRFDDGTRLPCRGLLFKPPTTPRSRVPEQLGAASGPDGMPIVDRQQQTTVPFLFVAGDMGTMPPSLLNAAASGQLAGAGLNNALAFADAEARARGVPTR